MAAPILIIGQGLAGTLLAWEFERAGFDFEIADAGADGAASQVAAGIINPITGQRFVKSWRVDTLLPAARSVYREMQKELGVPVVRDMRIWRLFANRMEHEHAVTKAARGEWAPFVDPRTLTDEGVWIESALQVDVPGLLQVCRGRWIRQGRLQTRRAALNAERGRRDVVIVCTGAGVFADGPSRIPFARAKGEILRTRAVDAFSDPAVIRNDGAWLLPLDDRHAWVGATYERNAVDLEPSTENRAILKQHAMRLFAGAGFSIEGQQSGWRMTLPDRRPVAGRLPDDSTVGIINGLGSKGALYAPWLARQWVNHLSEGVPFDPDVAVERVF